MSSAPARPIDQRIARAIIEEATERASRDGRHNCLIWPDRIGSGGYGVTGWGGHRAHRVAWAAVHGDPGELMVRHVVCGNAACFDISHLDVGTAADNNEDTRRMGRHASQHLRLLTEDAKTAAVDLVNSGHSIAAVAKMFDVGSSTIQRAVAGKLDPTVTTGRHARKVRDEDVLRARKDFGNGTTIRDIADRLGISWPAAQKMIQGRTYGHIGGAHPGAASRKERVIEPCSVDGCDRPSIARALCTMHYDRLLSSGSVGAAEPKRAKLDAAKVRAIRQRRAEAASLAEIMREFNISRTCVRDILAGRTWRHVT